MTITLSARQQRLISYTVTLDEVVQAITEVVDSPRSEIVQCLALLNGHLQASRRSGYVPQHITNELVVRIMSTLITQSGRRSYMLGMIKQLLLHRHGEQGLDCRDWTVYGDPSIAVFIRLDP